jgi:predicted permease
MLEQARLFVNALANVLPIIFLLMLGTLLRRSRFIRPETIDDIKKLIVNLTLPAVLFMAFAGVNLELRYLVVSISVFVLCLFALLLGRLIGPIAGIKSPYFPLLLSGFEAGMLGYAIYGAVYGQENIFRFGIVDLGQVLFVFFVMVPLLERFESGARPFRKTVQGFFKTPVILAILAGILFSQLGLTHAFRSNSVGNSFFETLALLGALTTPLVALYIGYDLQLRSGSQRNPVLTAGIRLAIWVMIGLGLNALLVDGLLGLERGFQSAVLTMFVLPPPFVMPLFMDRAPIEERNYVLNTLTLATVLALFAFALVSIVYPAL